MLLLECDSGFVDFVGTIQKRTYSSTVHRTQPNTCTLYVQAYARALNNLTIYENRQPIPHEIRWCHFDYVFQLNKAEGNFVKFKSTFFGTFATNGLFLPPTSIDFDSLFANFLDRLLSTPHVLATFIVLFTLLIVLTVVLRRKDKRDLFMVSDIKYFKNKNAARCYWHSTVTFKLTKIVKLII